jgi:isopentenyldiphosphate isomerase
MANKEEFLEVVTEKGEITKTLPRSEIHGNPSLIHRVVHALVFSSKGALLLQKRSMRKDVAPGKWDTSVGGHVNPGETLNEAVKREMKEELGITSCKPEFLYSYIHSNEYETELVYTYSCIYNGKIDYDREEIDEVRAWSIEEIKQSCGKGILSDNFEHEFAMYIKVQKFKIVQDSSILNNFEQL